MTALADVSLSVTSGEFVCIYGASGSGKSTLLHTIAGLSDPDSGNVQVDDRDVFQLTRNERADLRRERVGVIFQDHNLMAELNVLENVALPLRVGGTRASEAKTLAHQALSRLGIDNLAVRSPSELSGGQRQRVGIARVLASGQDAILADEPTGALDSTNSEALFILLKALSADGACVVVATHDPLARQFATRTHTMIDGRIAMEKVAGR
ncbi:ABC transporter ATP-binding protein [Nocardioides rubriscoriae]|uniref:ABC transporter ATP-binding protein n=1 Tax=Nocardioides rubriscoriae TaxID=642762 RepID=UPI001FE95920|nr:ABC transporter ATP-binding protein [Nocardioides rubriscoriae]